MSTDSQKAAEAAYQRAYRKQRHGALRETEAQKMQFRADQLAERGLREPGNAGTYYGDLDLLLSYDHIGCDPDEVNE